MNNLYIDTCTGELLIAVTTPTIEKRFDEVTAKKTSEMMFPLIQNLLSSCNISLKEINNIYVTKGPGSYTGSRLGLTFAKVLKVLNPSLNVYTCTTLQALLASTDSSLKIAVIDARNQAYFASTSKTDEEDCARLEKAELEEYFKKGYTPICYHLEKNTLEALKDHNIKGVNPLDGMLNNKDIFIEIDNVNDIKPFYLKGHGRE